MPGDAGLGGAAELIGRLTLRLYGKPLVRNVLRGELVEQMILDVLGPDWCAGDDYESWDIVHRSLPVRIQVKQSAARQTWHRDAERSTPRFAIDERTGYSGTTGQWDQLRARHAEVFVFAWHPVLDATADQRDVAQWLFYAVATPLLPQGQATIGLQGLTRLARPVTISELGDTIIRLSGIAM